MKQDNFDIDAYILWLIKSHDDIKNTSQAVAKIAEISSAAISTTWQWKSGFRKPLSAYRKLLSMYRENHEN